MTINLKSSGPSGVLLKRRLCSVTFVKKTTILIRMSDSCRESVPRIREMLGC